MNLKQMTSRMRRTGAFLAQDIWDIELTSLSALRRLGVQAIRVVQLVFKGFREDECPLHASALTFSTLMSIVPILALSLALARGLGDAETARNKIRDAVAEWTQTFSSAESTAPKSPVGEVDKQGPDATDSIGEGPAPDAGMARGSALADEINGIVEEGFERIENISFRALGGVGLVLLLWMVIRVLGRVEGSFNRVWGVTEGRSLWRKFTDYLSVLFILPVLVIAASSFPVANFATRFLHAGTADFVHAVLESALLKGVTVWLMSTLCFAFIIMFLPNTRVRIRPGLVGGLVTALLFLLWLRTCAALQVGVAKWGKIYGSFAVVPIMLFWVYVSWQIIFFGAEVAFAVQNCSTYRMEQGARMANVQAKILLSLALAESAARGMLEEGGKPLNMAEFARQRRVPVRFLNDVVSELVRAGVLAELSERQGAYVFLKSPEHLRVGEIVSTVMRSGVGPEDLGLTDVTERVREVAARASGGMDASIAQVTVKDLLPGNQGEACPGT